MPYSSISEALQALSDGLFERRTKDLITEERPFSDIGKRGCVAVYHGPDFLGGLFVKYHACFRFLAVTLVVGYPHELLLDTLRHARVLSPALYILNGSNAGMTPETVSSCDVFNIIESGHLMLV